MNILVTGGAGYIGSHICIELLLQNESVVVLDNLCNSNIKSLQQIEKLTKKKITFVNGDIRDYSLINTLLAEHTFDAVIHLAGLKSVRESCYSPLKYYDNNVNGTLVLCKALAKYPVKPFIFSSSATVYGVPKMLPLNEQAPLLPTNPYGQSKLMVETILQDLNQANQWNIALLRYFNPAGAHHSGLVGEAPSNTPENLLPCIAQVASGKQSSLKVFGGEYPTTDGTGVRDYIHVVDLAKGHVAALNKLKTSKPACHIWNLGTGNGFSVLEMIKAFETASGKKVPYEIVSPRAGDIATCFASVDKANQELKWKAERTLKDMMQDTWRWQSQHPNGYGIQP